MNWAKILFINDEERRIGFMKIEPRGELFNIKVGIETKMTDCGIRCDSYLFNNVTRMELEQLRDGIKKMLEVV